MSGFHVKEENNVNRSFVFDVRCHVEVRRCDLIENKFKDKNGKDVHFRYLEVSCEDDSGNPFVLKDRMVDNQSFYHRGLMGTFVLQIRHEEGYRGKTQINIKNFIPDEDQE